MKRTSFRGGSLRSALIVVCVEPKLFRRIYFDFSDLTLFIAVAEEESLLGGAERVFISPSAASQRLKNLESKLDVKLFERTPAGLRMTEAGREFLFSARKLVREALKAQERIYPYSSAHKRVVNLCGNSTGIALFTEEIGKYLKLYPDSSVRFRMRELISDEAVESVLRGESDIAICTSSGQFPELEFTPYRNGDLIFITKKDHPLANCLQISLEIALDYGFVTLSENSAMQKVMEERANHLGRTTEVIVQAGTFYDVVNLVRAGAGVGIVPAPFVQASDGSALFKDIVLIKLRESWAVRPLSVISLQNKGSLSAQSLHFLEFLQNCACRLPIRKN